jgi:hypothetical protein
MVLKAQVWHTYRINMGNYEHVEFGASREFDANDPDGLQLANEQIEADLAPLLEKAREHTAEEDSFVHEWSEEADATPVNSPSQPGRRRR